MSNELLTPIVLHLRSPQDPQAAVKELVSQTKDVLKPQISFINTEAENISIETIRQLITELSYATDPSITRVMAILHAELLSLPAQQALLKSLEEPPVQTLLVLVTNNPQTLLPTILSRCVTIQDEGEETDQTEPPEYLKKLLESPQSGSLADSITFAESYKDRGEAVVLVSDTLQWLHNNPAVSPSSKRHAEKQLAFCLTALQKNASVQLTLEECLFRIQTGK